MRGTTYCASSFLLSSVSRWATKPISSLILLHVKQSFVTQNSRQLSRILAPSESNDKAILFTHSCSSVLATFISLFRDLHASLSSLSFNQSYKLFPFSQSLPEAAIIATSLLFVDCCTEVTNLKHFTSAYFSAPGAPAGGASHASA